MRQERKLLWKYNTFPSISSFETTFEGQQFSEFWIVCLVHLAGTIKHWNVTMLIWLGQETDD